MFLKIPENISFLLYFQFFLNRMNSSPDGFDKLTDGIEVPRAELILMNWF